MSVAIIYVGKSALDVVQPIVTFATPIIVFTTPWVIIMGIGDAVRRRHYPAG